MSERKSLQNSSVNKYRKSKNAKVPDGWREIFMKQSVGKCKQINF